MEQFIWITIKKWQFKNQKHNKKSKDQFLIEVDMLIYIRETLTPIERENIIKILEHSCDKVNKRYLVNCLCFQFFV